MFGDPCPGTHKYVEIHYACVSQSAGPVSGKTSTPKLPPWLLEGGASNLWSSNVDEDTYDEDANVGSGDVFPPSQQQPTDATTTTLTTAASGD